MIVCGEERKPTESRTVTVRPGYVMLERSITADWPAVKFRVFTNTRDVSPLTTTGVAIHSVKRDDLPLPLNTKVRYTVPNFSI